MKNRILLEDEHVSGITSIDGYASRKGYEALKKILQSK